MENHDNEEFIKNELKKYMNGIDVPENLEGIIMNNVEHGKNEEKKKLGKSKKIIAGAACFVVVAGTISIASIAGFRKSNDNNETTIGTTNSQVVEEKTAAADKKILNIELTDKDLYAVGFGDIAFIENGEVYYGYRKALAEDSSDYEILVKKISGINDAVSIGAYNLSTDVSKTFYVVTESGKLYRLTYGQDCTAVRVFEDYEIKSVVSAQGEENHEYVFILKDNRKIKINTYREGETIVKELDKYSSVNITGNKGNKQIGSDLYSGGYLSMSFLINGNAYLCTKNSNASEGDLTINVKKVNNLSDVKNIKALAIGNDPSLTYFAIKENGEVYDYFYTGEDSAEKSELMNDYKVETIIEAVPNGSTDDGMDAYEIKLRLKDGKTVSVYTGNPVNEDNNTSTGYISDLYNEKYDEHLFRLPKINIDSTYANEINSRISKIKDDVEKSIDAFEEEKKTGSLYISDEYTTYYHIDYDYYVNKDVISIIIIERQGGDNDNYEIFNIDVINGNRVTKERMLESRNIAKDDFQNKIYNYIENNKKDWYSGVDNSFYASKENCSLEKCELVYLDNKVLAVAIPVGGTDVGGKQLIDIETGKVIEKYSIGYYRW